MPAAQRPKSSTQEARELRAQLERCQELCASALRTVDDMEGERASFLAHNFEDALQQMELILRVLEEDATQAKPGGGDSDEPVTFLKRLARGLARKEDGEILEEGDDHELPDLRRPATGLQGNTWTFSLPELVGFLAASRKTGVLWVDGPDENFLLGMVEGQLVHAASSATPEGLRLGEILVELGFLTARQLERFLSSEEGAELLSGESLLKSGMISEEELHTALTVQVQELFHRLLETRNSIFRFREGMQISVAHHVFLNTTQLILESARVKDELEKNAELNELAEQMASLQPGDEAPSEWSQWDEAALERIEQIDAAEGEDEVDDESSEPAGAIESEDESGSESDEQAADDEQDEEDRAA